MKQSFTQKWNQIYANIDTFRTYYNEERPENM